MYGSKFSEFVLNGMMYPAEAVKMKILLPLRDWLMPDQSCAQWRSSSFNVRIRLAPKLNQLSPSADRTVPPDG